MYLKVKRKINLKNSKLLGEIDNVKLLFSVKKWYFCGRF